MYRPGAGGCVMSGTKGAVAEDEEAAPPEKKGGKKKLLLAVPVVLVAIGAGLWFSGVLPGLLGMKGKAGASQSAEKRIGAPVYVDVPELITNLNVPGRRQSYLKLHAKLEVGGPEDVAPVTAAMPRILDLFQTYLRDMRPEELRGSEGSYRLREELVGRAAVAVAPAHVQNVLFEELIMQ
jgi:flagellar protein FliL